MPVIRAPGAVSAAVLSDPARGWRRMIRIDTRSGDVGEVVKATNGLLPERLVYAEGDSWFGPSVAPTIAGPNLLDAIRTPFVTAVVDVSHVGDEARDMVRGHQARQTRAMFRLFGFQAILLSAGGNDLKNLFADLYMARALAQDGFVSRFERRDLARLAHPESYREHFAELMAQIGRFVELRDSARNEVTRQAPIFVHGYDHLQPRPAGAAAFAGSRIGRGPWLHPALKAAGLDDAAMRAAVSAVVDELNLQLEQVIAPLTGVHLIDQRGLLEPAAPGTQGPDGDWADEIHPDLEGFNKLARQRWDVPVSLALGWKPAPGERVAGRPPPGAGAA